MYERPKNTSYEVDIGLSGRDDDERLDKKERPVPTSISRKVRMLARNSFARATGLSKRQIVDFFCRYSDDVPEYPWDPDLEYRADYFDRCLAYLPADVQRRALLDLCDHVGDMNYGAPDAREVDHLKSWLQEEEMPLQGPPENLPVDWHYVQQHWGKALAGVNSDPEGAVSAARTLLETVCKHILEERGISFRDDGNLPSLFKAAAGNLDLSGNVKADACLKQMIGGSFSIVNGLSGLRNEHGDAHGKGKSYVGPEPRHARYALNATAALATFLIDCHKSVGTDDI